MVAQRTCSFRKEDGQPCRAAPLHDGPFCLWHSPEHAEEVQEARRLGGVRRRRERSVARAYDFAGLNEVSQVRRLLEIAIVDTLALENSAARSRTLAYLGIVALKVFEVGELEARVAAVEAALGPRLPQRAADGSRKGRWRP